MHICRPSKVLTVWVGIVLINSGSAYAASSAGENNEDSDLNALSLADQLPSKVETASNWRSFTEVAFGDSHNRYGDSQTHRRLSIDTQYDGNIATDWRAVLSDRLDIDSPAQANAQHGSSNENSINTIKEAYLSWQAQPNLMLDMGRINVRNGVALGYNPTDYFRSGAQRSVVSADPISMKENRQGSIMLRAQRLWDGGSITALASPQLETDRNTATFNPDLAATNSQNRYLLAISQRIANGITPQLLVFKDAQHPVQLGVNLTALVNDSTVAFMEWSGGQNRSSLSDAYSTQGIPSVDDQQYRHHLASGMTYTTRHKLSLTAELQYNGSGLDEHEWEALPVASLPLYGLYRSTLQTAQESPTKRAAFLYSTWQDAGISHLDVSAMERIDLEDNSRMTWIEARYHVSQLEYALQWQHNGGSSFSQYGAARQIHTLQASLRYFF